MSAIVAMLDVRDAPGPAIERERLAGAVLQALGRRTRHRAMSSPSARVTLAHGTAWPEVQCHYASSGDGSIVAVADARIDNARELALGDVGAADAIVRAYERWGARCADVLRGDFAFILWDGRRRELVGARDALGVKPLYYQLASGRLRLASEPHALFADTSLVPRPHLESVALYACNEYFENGPTLYEGVFALPSGHSFRAPLDTLVSDALRGSTQGNPLRLERYFRPECVAALDVHDDEDLARMLADRLQRAVRARMPSAAPVGVLLSGGIDSSAVACVAAQEARRAKAPAPLLAHVSYEPLPCDERRYALAVATHCGVPLVAVDANAELARTLPGGCKRPDLYYHPGGLVVGAAYARAASEGVRVVMTGHGGDLCFDRTGRELSERVRHGEMRAALRESSVTARPVSISNWRSLARAVVRSAIPPRARAAWRRSRGAVPMLMPQAAEAVRRRREAREPAPPWERGEVTAAYGARATSSLAQVCLACDDRIAWSEGVELRHPFFDRDLVELLLAMPLSQRQVPGLRKAKPVLRRALRPTLPALCYQRTEVTEFSPHLEQTLAAAGTELRALFQDSRLEALGVLRPEAAREAAEAATGRELYRMLNHAALELWLRQL